MAHPAIIDRVSFFYPIGNTPAVCLTKDIPREIPAKVLLLGCGDVRNVLYTCYVDRDTSRPMDITCCDIQPAIIARNICLLSLVLDNKNPDKDNSIWDIYYHLYIDKTALQILNVQAKNLLTASKSLQSWNESQYGSLFRFCDSGTFSRVVKIWSVYAASDKNARDIFSAKLKKDISRSGKAKLDIFGDGELAGLYSKHGLHEANPMFESNGTLNYNLDPLFGFHLEPAHVSLAPTSLFKAATDKKFTAKALDTARLEFATWCNAYKNCAARLTLRFFTGDALAFCQALHHVRQRNSNTVANGYRRQGCFEPLLLDSQAYGIGGNGPLMFTVVDTSNLVDHLGALNVLVAISPLLMDKIYATLFTEVLAKKEYTHMDAVNNLICGDFATMALLLGLLPVEYYTKATVTTVTTVTSSDAGSSNRFSKFRDQSLLRINWKRTLQSQDSAGIVPMSFDPSDLAALLFKVYLAMFSHETFSSMIPNGNRSFTIPHFHRGSFSKLLELVESRVSDEWHIVVDILVDLIEQDITLVIGRNYIQELYTYLHLTGLYSVNTLRTSFRTSLILWSKWESPPLVVCITLKVPRSKLKILTDMEPWQFGIHTFNGSLLDSAGQWQNHFGALQYAFGTVTPKGHRHAADFEINIEEDEHGWQGESSLLVSFLAPSWFFGLSIRPPLVSLCLQPSPQTAAKFGSRLGLQMTLYQTALSDEANVFITPNWPNLGAFSPPADFAHSLPLKRSYEKNMACTKLLAQINRDVGSIERLVGHADVISDAVKLALQNGGKVEIEQKTPLQVIAIIAGKHRIHINFPVPVASVGRKVRVARKSSYIEVIVPLLRPADHESFPEFMHPIFLEGGLPSLWNMPRVNPDGMAKVDLTDPDKLKWLRTHISLMWSHREGAMRMANISGKNPPNRDLRMEFKKGLFTMFMMFSGALGSNQKSLEGNIFALYNENAGGISMIIVVSSFRLDGANGIIVLDAAALPLTAMVASKVSSCIQSLQESNEKIFVKVGDEQLGLWNELLPAYAERCRTWSHKASCEYKTRKSIPVTTERGESPLCSCGQGIFPSNFTRDDSTKKYHPQWDTLKKYATRVAISPSFSAPVAERQIGADPVRQSTPTEESNPKMARLEELSKMFANPDQRAAIVARWKLKSSELGKSLSEEDVIRDGVVEYMESSVHCCDKCGKEKRESGEPLLRCSKCHKAKYCSSECQKAQWKQHKKICGKD